MIRSWAGHLCRDILPWWEINAVDDVGGGVLTGFDNRGQLHTTDRFTWSEGRWAWVCAELADDASSGRLPLDADLWRQRCLQTCERIVRLSLRADGRTHFRLTEAGEPVSDASGETATSVFADLFAVLGLAAGIRTLAPEDPRQSEWQQACGKVLATAYAAVRNRTALSEPYPVPEGFSDLAGPMNLLHTAAEMLRIPLGESVAMQARAVRDWAAARIHDTHLTSDGWREFAPRAACDEDTLLARHRTPGHLLELLWMAKHAQQSDPTLVVIPEDRMVPLAEQAIRMSWDQRHGGLLRYTDERQGTAPQGRAMNSRYEELVRQTWDTKLWWVHSEAIYALNLLAPQDPGGGLAPWASMVSDWTMDTFPNGAGQEWTQIRTRDGRPFDEVVALPVKDPFHIIRALVLTNRLSEPTEEST
ncbi:MULTISPECIES: AGE family epimerase/isomerase [unclassified Luteococcus]|uniref:AGE family epimerase/isomerase n=1 Tax=unclassified Luteococcus TaxID=2639923 RepID=UPI00313C3718